MPSDPQINILLVDDHPENLLALEAVLGSLGENLVKANSGEEALRCLLEQDFAVILLDVQMPDMNGFETADLIRNRDRSRQTPIIFLTAFSASDDLVFKGYAVGAVDYLHKPIDPGILTSKVTVFVDLFRKTEMVKRQTAAVERQAAQLKRVNAELQQSEERFRLLSVCSPVGIFLLDIAGRCTYTNPRCQEICGFSAGKELGEGWLQFVHSDDQLQAQADWAICVQTQQEVSAEYRFPTPEGNLCWTHVRTSPMFSDQGEIIGHVGTIEDITEQKQAESVREQMLSEQIARREAETANRMKDEFLAVLSHELRTPLNAMLGWSRLLRTRKLDQKTIDRALETIERNANSQAQLIEDILDVSKVIRGKLRLNWLPVNLVSVIEAAIDVVRPQSETKSIQIEFTANTDSPQTWGDAMRLQQVIWNLLSNAIKFSQEKGRVEVKLERQRAEGRGQQEEERERQRAEGRGQQEEESQDSGSGEMQSEDQENQSSSLLPSASRPLPSDFFQITVTDSGIGISPDFLPNVFDRFRQADSTITRSHNGLGLGLAIVHHLVELHGGTVQAESQGEGQGATFTVQLPLRQKQSSVAAVPDEMESASPRAGTLEGVKVLLVEDEADARDFLNFALQQYGATAIVIKSVKEALDKLEELQPDVLISDIAMPEQDGYTLIQQIRQAEQNNGRSLPTIALTAYSSVEDHQKALSAGFNAHLPKPVEMNKLVDAIVELIEEKS